MHLHFKGVTLFLRVCLPKLFITNGLYILSAQPELVMGYREDIPQAEVFYWGFSKDGFGHLSLQLDNATYISH